MAVNADALTTPANLKEELNITGTAKDGKLERVINRATWWIEDRRRRKFNNGTQGGLKARRYNGDTASAPNNVHTTTMVRDEDYIYFDGTTQDRGGDTIVNRSTGLGEFHLPAYPVQANSVLTFALAVLSGRSNSGGETWDTDRLPGERRSTSWTARTASCGCWAARSPRARGTTAITMAAGYQYGDNQPYVPPDLEGLCIELCKQAVPGRPRRCRARASERGRGSIPCDARAEDPTSATSWPNIRRYSSDDACSPPDVLKAVKLYHLPTTAGPVAGVPLDARPDRRGRLPAAGPQGARYGRAATRPTAYELYLEPAGGRAGRATRW